MKGTYLRFYMHENQKHHGVPLHEWLLTQAKQRGVAGGSAFRSIGRMLVRVYIRQFTVQDAQEIHIPRRLRRLR